MLGMKTQCMRTKSSTAGSGRERKKTESGGKWNGKRKEVRGSEREVALYLGLNHPSGLCCCHFLFKSVTWFTGMYVHSHRLQEVLKDLLGCSRYHSVPAGNEE